MAGVDLCGPEYGRTCSNAPIRIALRFAYHGGRKSGYRIQEDRGVHDVGIAIILKWLSILYFGRIGCWLYGCTKKYIVDENVPVTDVRFDIKIRLVKHKNFDSGIEKLRWS